MSYWTRFRARVSAGLACVFAMATATGLLTSIAPPTEAATGSAIVTGTVVATYAVNSTNDVDDGVCDAAHCSLREAINRANSTAGTDAITFAIPGSGPYTIAPTSALPAIGDAVVIDGTTQAGYAGSPIIELDGTLASVAGGVNGATGLDISAGGSTVRGLVINRFTGPQRDGIRLRAAGGNVVEGNFIGTDVSGTIALGNNFGVSVYSNSQNNRIGGTAPGARNVLSGNLELGLQIQGPSTGNAVQGNFIGTDASGTAALGNGSTGIFLFGSGNTIGGTSAADRNVIAGNRSVGVDISFGSGNVVQGNFIGTDVTGSVSLGTEFSTGVQVSSGTSGNVVGGTAAGAGNVISGDRDGVIIRSAASANRIEGNFIGTDATGSAVVSGRRYGIWLDDAPNTMVGGTANGAGNVIAGSAGAGILVMRAGATGNTIQGNSIGTNASGTTVLPNSFGIDIEQGAGSTEIGGTSPAARNVISGNSVGVIGVSTTQTTIEGNLIGTNRAGTGPLGNLGDGVALLGVSTGNTIGGTTPGAANVIAHNGRGVSVAAGRGNRILANSIHSNGQLGIDLRGDGVTFNDAGDVDTGANDLQNMPVLGATSGALASLPGADYTIEFFSNAACDSSGYGEGETFLSRLDVTADASGNATFAVPPGIATLTATATDPDGNTSEFSACTPTSPDNGGGGGGGGGGDGSGIADLELTKEGPAIATAGEELTYTIKVKNNGPDVATNVMVNDTLPSGLVAVSTDPAAPACQGNVTVVCNLGTLAVGQIGIATIVARAEVYGEVHNDATTTSDQGDGNPNNNTGGWGTILGPPPVVSAHKGVAVLNGPTLRYTIDVENEGPTTAYGVVAKDILDPGWTLLHVDTTQGVCDGQVVCAIGTLAVGQKETVTIEIGIVTYEPVHNDVDVTWFGGGFTTTGVTSAGIPFVVVSKTHNGNFFAGENGTYNVAVSNIGTGATTDAIIVTDTLPEGMTFVSGGGDGFACSAVGQIVTCTRSAALNPQSSANFPITVDIDPNAPRNPINLIEIRGGGGKFQLDGGSDPGTIVDPPVLGIAKTVKEHVVRIGHNFTYLIDVKNTGTTTANNVQVIDTLPGSVDLVSVTPGPPTCSEARTVTCNLGDLPVGETVTVEIVVKAREITVLDNEAFASADGMLPHSSGHVSTPVLEEPQIGVEKVADQPVVLQDSTLRYTITAKNLGPGDASNVKINDPLPTGVTLLSITPDPTYGMTCNVTAPPEITNLTQPVVCTIPVLPELTTSKVVLVVHVLRIGPLANTATVTSDDTGTRTAGTSTSNVFVASPSISIAKTTNGSDGGSLWVGDAITWRYRVTNTGNATLTNVQVTDDKITSSAIHCGGGANVITSLAAGASQDCTATGPATAGPYTNVGTATGTPPVGTNVTASDRSSYTGFTTGMATPTATTCQTFAGHTSATLTYENYLVSKGKIGSISPGVFFYYSKIAVTASTPSFLVKQSNSTRWPALSVQQAVLWDANCVKTAVKATTDISGATTFDTHTLRPGTYYISVKYDPGSLTARSVSTPYPTVPYTLATYLGPNLYLSSTAVVTFRAK
jgi:uncharacterized repeat protein (TIGR01451 family)/CSLREA domain-containing protein